MTVTRTTPPPLVAPSSATSLGTDLVRDGDHWVIELRSATHGRDLSDLLPAVEAFGFHVVDASTMPVDDGIRQRLEVTTEHDLGDDHRERVTAALQAALTDRVPTDPLLELVTATTMNWSDVEVLRAYRHVFDLVGTGWSPSQVTRTLLAHPSAAATLVSLFAARLSPDADPTAATGAAHALDNLRAGMASLHDDRIVADLAHAVNATLRTNAWAPNRTVTLPDGRTVDVLACKFRSADLPGVPAPVPHAEILVTSSLTTGIHLRGGAVSRGGLRASDRADDLRSEVLELVTAQIVKNSMIVPTGAKGGFVLRHPPTDPGDVPAAISNAYRVFVSGLLSVTDNVVDGDVVGPEGVTRLDGDDPYLVVAADKGTARLSDTANELALASGFWLGDAFASGGSAGYDHKELGITARGAWTAIARHFRELGIDIHTDPITMTGIGDMSGDVFGNGLLTSDRLRLVAAFDHRDVFIDPDPDEAAAFEERRRLFELPGSSWQDYDRAVLSEGGGVYSRQAKQVALSDSARELLGVDTPAPTPDEVIRAILQARVDLLYAGGIGTYIAASEGDDVNDIGNAPVRVHADEVRARVIGEGANLAITQRGRIEFARRGGRVDQDAVHNAAGVAISDREVNCKILLAPLVADARLDDDERNEILHAATDEVVAAVLDDVDAQVWLLSRQHARSADELDAHQRHLARLEEAGVIDRAVDVLPSDEELATRAEAGGGLTRPELATVIAATKRALTAAVTASDLVAADAARAALVDYFPASMVQRVGEDTVTAHRLADEITALRLTSDVVDRHGPTVCHDLARDHGVDVVDVVASFAAAQTVLDGRDWWRRLRGLSLEVPATTLDDVAARLGDLEVQVARTILADGVTNPDETVRRLRPVATMVADLGAEAAVRGPRGRVRLQLLDDLVPDDLAVAAATADQRADSVDVAGLVDEVEPDTVGAALDALVLVDARLGIADARGALASIATTGWTRRLGVVLAQDLRDARRRAARMVLSSGADRIAVDHDNVDRLRSIVRDAIASDDTTAALATAVGAIRRQIADWTAGAS